MIEHFLNFFELCFISLRDSRFHLSHFQKSGYVCRLLSQCLKKIFSWNTPRIFCAGIVSKYLQSLPRVSRSRFTANEPLFLFSKNVSLFIVQKSLSNHSSVHFVCFQQWTQLPQRCFKLIQSEFCGLISKIFVFFVVVFVVFVFATRRNTAD